MKGSNECQGCWAIGVTVAPSDPPQDIIERSREERQDCHTGCDSEPFQPMPHARVCAIGVNLVSCSEGKIIIQFLAKLPILAMF